MINSFLTVTLLIANQTLNYHSCLSYNFGKNVSKCFLHISPCLPCLLCTYTLALVTVYDYSYLSKKWTPNSNKEQFLAPEKNKNRKMNHIAGCLRRLFIFSHFYWDSTVKKTWDWLIDGTMYQRTNWPTYQRTNQPTTSYSRNSLNSPFFESVATWNIQAKFQPNLSGND